MPLPLLMWLYFHQYLVPVPLIQHIYIFCARKLYNRYSASPVTTWAENVKWKKLVFRLVHLLCCLWGCIVITCNYHYGIRKPNQHLFSHFQMKDLKKLKYFPNIEVAQSSRSVISHRRYTLDILEETSMLNCKLVGTPMYWMSNLYQDKRSVYKIQGDMIDL